MSLWDQISNTENTLVIEYEKKPQGHQASADVGGTGRMGSVGAAYADHVHRGVGNLNIDSSVLYGNIEIIEGDNISLTPDEEDRTLTIALSDDIEVSSVTADEATIGILELTDALVVKRIDCVGGSPQSELLMDCNVAIVGYLKVDVIEVLSDSPTGILAIDPDGNGVFFGGDVGITGDTAVAGTLRVDNIEGLASSPGNIMTITPGLQLQITGEVIVLGGDVSIAAGWISHRGSAPYSVYTSVDYTVIENVDYVMVDTGESPALDITITLLDVASVDMPSQKIGISNVGTSTGIVTIVPGGTAELEEDPLILYPGEAVVLVCDGDPLLVGDLVWRIF